MSGFPNNAVPFPGPGSEMHQKAVARLWADQNVGDWVFDHQKKMWFRYDGSRWLTDGVQLAFHKISEHCIAMGRGQKAFGSATFAQGVERLAQADPRVAVCDAVWDKDDFLVGTPGRTIDCRKGVLIEPDPKHMISKATGVEPDDGEPTLWLRFLDQATGGDQDLIRYLQQILGYCLTGSTKEHALFFIVGVGKNGKSVFLNTASKILGEYATTSAMSTFTAAKHDRHPTELAMLRGARLVTASETEEGRAWAEAKIKQLTGGDPISARFMAKNFFTYQPQFKLLFVGNHHPKLESVDEATKRRFNIIEFKHIPPDPDPDLEEKLAAEHGRILSWMLRGCIDWQKSGLVRPASVVAATNEYFEAQDLLGQFIADCCVTGQGRWEQPAHLYSSWCAFARDAGEAPNTASDFYANMRKRGFAKGKSNGVRQIRGIDLRSANGSER